MADRNPPEQQFDPKDDAGKDETFAHPKRSSGLEDSIDKATDNQSQVSPEDYPEKAGDIPL